MLPSTTLGFSFQQADASPPQVLVISSFRASTLGGIVSLTHNFLVKLSMKPISFFL
ncbi:hypothetical protein SLEP1_g49286 [Rubroshorea leprosula]|uniref:Uncharacterized protein n=1 Tax=Rubroshorea leprosula TaxID=152421 RepID=A0AAV5LWB7_9ROSI|nr:hypothetical protein SLEP1_g49286 [Rubroshorea leprosula]